MGKEIETLKKKHNVYILTFIASEFDETLAEKMDKRSGYHCVKVRGWSKFLHVVLEPFLPNYFAARSSLRFSLKLIWCVKRYKIDVIHAEYASMGQYLWIKRLFPGLRFNLVEHDVTVQSYERKVEASVGIRKWYNQYQLNRIQRCEKRYCKLADVIFTFNRKDKKLIEQYFGVTHCFVLNIYYGIEDVEMINGKCIEKDFESANICFVGQMGRDENYLAAMRLIGICETVRKVIPELQVYIVGNNPPSELIKRENEYIHITGFVDDVDDYLKKAQVAVFPLTLGAGIKVKVLRSLALGTPVITGNIGSEGIDEEGNVIVLAETDAEYIDRIESLLRDKQRLKELSKASSKYIVERFSWERSEEILNRVYNS